MKQGPIEQIIIKQAARDGTPLPNSIANAPDLEIGLQLFYVAFFELSTCRSFSQMSEGPIWWTAINDYCNQYNIRDSQRDDLFYHLNELDKVYLDYREKETKKQLDKNAKKGKIGKQNGKS